MEHPGAAGLVHRAGGDGDRKRGEPRRPGRLPARGIVAAADETRRRIERDLHDGIQQQLVSLMLELRMAQAAEPDQAGELKAQVAWTAQRLAEVMEELREISHGIHPAVLSTEG